MILHHILIKNDILNLPTFAKYAPRTVTDIVNFIGQNSVLHYVAILFDYYW